MVSVVLEIWLHWDHKTARAVHGWALEAGDRLMTSWVPYRRAEHAAADGDAAAVVTLEPCNHQGRTPPCRQILIDAGIRRTVIAIIDPTSRGEGGVVVIRRAGVETGVLADEARTVLGDWLAGLHNRCPLITCPI
jgi:diaminohydroxyphosphoribosylaminopyrimidine deaminase/5-amino-6-(5-phosphoribosylamino)uracil reductase